MSGPLLEVQARFKWQAQWTLHLVKVSPTCGFRNSFSTDGRRGTFAGDLPRCISRGRRSTRDTSISFGGQGADFLRRVAFWTFRFPKMILRDRCSTSCVLASLFHGSRSQYFRQMWKMEKRIGTRLSALRSTSVSEGSLAEVLRFWRCKCQKLKKPRRTAPFCSCQLTFFLKEVSQKCFVLDLPTSTFEGSLAELLRFGSDNFRFWRKSGIIASLLISIQTDR